MRERSWLERRMTSAGLILALLAGIALSVSLLRLDALQREFLAANFDSVHGARTLLKARHYVALALASLERSRDGQQAQHLAQAAELLALAENYGAEGKDANPKPRRLLNRRLRRLRQALEGPPPPDPASLIQEARELAAEYEIAELDRWGTLSTLNVELADRMGELRTMIGTLLGGLFVVIGLLGRALIVTRAAESELRLAKQEIEATQQTTLDASPIGFLYVDGANPRTCRIVRANRRTTDFLGDPPERIVGRGLFDLIVDDDLPAGIGLAIATRLATGAVVQHEFHVRRNDGSVFWGDFTGKAIDPADPALGVVWTLENIDARKQAEERLREAREQAEAANRAKSEFLANMSHEIRTPFTAILGVLDTLLHSPLDERQRHLANLGHSSARQLLAIVNDILDLSKIEAGKLTISPSEIDLRAIVEDVAAVHAAAAEAKGIGFAHRLVGDVPRALIADGVRLRQVIDNLLANAIKFTSQGEVRLTVRSTHITGSVCRLHIEVADTGIGIAPELHECIFEKFTQADSSTTRLFGGTGLGLAICHQLVTQMGGRIGVESAPGEGSTFRCELDFPAAPTTQATVAEHAQATQQPNRFDGRVLLVDDTALVREASRSMFESFGLEVSVAECGEEALAHCERDDLDLVLLDLRMPGLDGFATARAWRQRENGRARTAIIAVSAESTADDLARMREAGMDDFLPKPYDRKDVSGLLQRWLGPAL